MAVSRQERERVRALDTPSAEKTRAAIREYVARMGWAVADFAERMGYSAPAVHAFLQGSYAARAGTDAHFRAAAWEFMRRRPLNAGVRTDGRLYETENVRRIRSYFEAALRGEVCLLYGPPGTQKSFTLLHLIAEHNRAGTENAVYVYASIHMTPMSLMRRITRQAGLHVSAYKEQVISNFINWAGSRETPPAVIVDEAQHLTVAALEQARELHDLAGCGLVLAGSHNLYEDIQKNRRWLEQWISRQDRKEPLPGLLENEVRAIAEQELGVKLPERQFAALLHGCRVDDFYVRNAQGRTEPRKYFSVRRLVKQIAQYSTAKRGAA